MFLIFLFHWQKRKISRNNVIGGDFNGKMPGDRVDRFETNCMQKNPTYTTNFWILQQIPRNIQTGFKSEFRDKNKRKNY